MSFIYTGTLPSWLIWNIANDSIQVVPDSFRASTKTTANAAAQAALDDFIAAAIESGELTQVE